MANDIYAAGEVGKEIVSVAIHHLGNLRIPKGVFVVLSEVHRAYDVHVLVVDRLPVEYIGVEGEHKAGIVVGLVGRLVLRSFLAFYSNHFAGEMGFVGVVVGIVHGTISFLGSFRGLLSGYTVLLVGRLGTKALGFLVLGVNTSNMLQIPFSASTGVIVNIFIVGDVLKHVVRHYALSLMNISGPAAARCAECSESLFSFVTVTLVNGECMAGRLADVVLVVTAVGNSAKHVGRNYVADMVVVAGGHLGNMRK